ncbi:NAD(P)/FAD-dependent oxidoreductase [Timonella sp. A28]|uniref:NAD(P)/FAD-dependent oxidoreductase n=1 Tax=Timonella sp. A28 TaxID=3442640 RepID=UPI003EB8557D
MSSEYRYVIVGAGTAADAAARGIRERDPSGTLLIIGSESYPPYDRPPLSKSLWKKGDVSTVDFHTAQDTDATVWTDTTVVELHPEHHEVVTHDGTRVSYSKLLLATGGTPRTISPASNKVVYFRTQDDFATLRAQATPEHHIAVIGGGFIGIEIACALAGTGARVTLVVFDEVVGASVYPPGLCTAITDALTHNNVKILTRRQAVEIEETAEQVTVYFDAHPAIHVDAVVAGLGITPNISLARDAGLPTEAQGVVVNQYLQTSDTDIYAAGDIAYFPDVLLGRRRVEHVDQAHKSGLCAGKNMALANEPYTHTPFFYSDIFELGFEAVGRLNSAFDMFEDWVPEKENKQGIVYYIDDGALVGVLLWNVWDSTDKAREALRQFGNQDSIHAPEKQLKGLIPM